MGNLIPFPYHISGDIAFRMLEGLDRQNKNSNSSTDDDSGSRKNTTILISDINQVLKLLDISVFKLISK